MSQRAQSLLSSPSSVPPAALAEIAGKLGGASAGTVCVKDRYVQARCIRRVESRLRARPCVGGGGGTDAASACESRECNDYLTGYILRRIAGQRSRSCTQQAPRWDTPAIAPASATGWPLHCSPFLSISGDGGGRDGGRVSDLELLWSGSRSGAVELMERPSKRYSRRRARQIQVKLARPPRAPAAAGCGPPVAQRPRGRGSGVRCQGRTVRENRRSHGRAKCSHSYTAR